MANFTAIPERTALVNIDMQNLFVDGTPDGIATLDRIHRHDSIWITSLPCRS